MAAIASSEAAAASHSADIDLTLDSDHAGEPQQTNLDIDPSLGGSADKPIELDLDIDMQDMFGPEPSSGGIETLFSPTEGRVKAEEIFPDFSQMENTGRDLFLGASQNPGHPHAAGGGESPFDPASIDLGSLEQSFLLQPNSDMSLDELFKSGPSPSAPTQGTSGGTGG